MLSKDEMINEVRNNLQNIPVSSESIEDAISDENLETSYALIQKHPNMTDIEYRMRTFAAREREGKIYEQTSFISSFPLHSRKHGDVSGDSST
jgi:hypothetical protein